MSSPTLARRALRKDHAGRAWSLRNSPEEAAQATTKGQEPRDRSSGGAAAEVISFG